MIYGHIKLTSPEDVGYCHRLRCSLPKGLNPDHIVRTREFHMVGYVPSSRFQVVW